MASLITNIFKRKVGEVKAMRVIFLLLIIGSIQLRTEAKSIRIEEPTERDASETMHATTENNFVKIGNSSENFNLPNIPAPLSIQKYSKDDSNQEVITFNMDIINAMFSNSMVKDRKIMVFSIIGAYRKGKSFFLGYCLRYLYAMYPSISTIDSFDGPSAKWIGRKDEPLKGFSWKPGRKADTNGILFWSDVFLHDNEETGEKIAIIIMDTQGLFEPGVSSDLNARIFGLSTLISSVQVINLNGVIQEDQLQYLEMSTEFTKLVKNSNPSKSKSSQIKPFQEMIFLIRDWSDTSTGLGFDGGAIVWEEIQHANSIDRRAQKVRKNLKNAFEKISAFLLPFPGENVTKADFNGSYGNLKTDFVKYLKIIIESIFKEENLTIKKVLGKEIIGSEFKDLLIDYFQAFNSDDLPEVESVFEATAARELEKLSNNLVNEYIQKMRANINLNESNFLNNFIRKHQIIQDEIIQKFNSSKKLGDEEIIEKFFFKLMSSLYSQNQIIQDDVFKRYNEDQDNKKEIERLNKEKEEEIKRTQEIKHQKDLTDRENVRKDQERINAEQKLKDAKEEHKTAISMMEKTVQQTNDKMSLMVQQVANIGSELKLARQTTTTTTTEMPFMKQFWHGFCQGASLGLASAFDKCEIRG